MKNEIKIILMVSICLAIIPSFVLAFGEVAGTVVINVPLGGSGTGSWGISDANGMTVKLSADGDAANYITLPDSITLLPNQIYWVNVTAKIPSDYNISLGTNITGSLYALSQGQPGQVQINLQLKKNINILVEQPQAQSSYFSGMSVLQPTYWLIGFGMVIILLSVYYFATKKPEVKM